MPCGQSAEECILDHWMPILGGRREPAGYRAPCPMCGSGRGLSIQIERRRPRWNNHCECDRDDVRAKLTAMLPGCVSARYAPRQAAARDLVELALADIPPQSLRLALLELTGMPTGEALAKLGIGPTHKGRVITPLRKLGRLPVSVRNTRSRPLPVSVTPWLTRFGKKSQVKARLTRS